MAELSDIRTLALGVLICASACGGDDGETQTSAPATTDTGDGDGDPGDGDPGDGDGDPGDGDGDTGDGDGDPGDGDPGDGDGDPVEPCAFTWEATQMKQNGQVHAAYDVAVGPSGEFVAVGRLENADDDAWIAKFDSQGQMLWEQVVDSQNGNDSASRVALDEAGDLYVVGSLRGTPDEDLWFEKRSGSDGAVVWSELRPSSLGLGNEPGGVDVAPDGDVIVSGAVEVGAQDLDVWVAKISAADGSELWSTTYTGQTDLSGYSIDRAAALSVGADGSIFVGATEHVDFETREAVLLAYSDGGALDWQLSPHADGQAHVHQFIGVAAGEAGEAYMAMYKTGVSWGFWLERVSADGAVVWTMTQEDFAFEPTKDWTVSDVVLSPDGQLTIGGTLREEEIGQGIDWAKVWLANVNVDGQGLCIASHTWQNAHIIPASTYGFGFDEGPNGTVSVGEIRDGPENYLWLGGFN